MRVLFLLPNIFSAPNFSSPFKLQVDASAVGAGAVLLQRAVPESVTSLRSSPSVNETTVPSRRKLSLWCWHSNIFKCTVCGW